MAITTIHDGNVPEEVRSIFTDVMFGLLNAILYPLTSTQLGIFSNFLDMRKLDALSTVDERARKIKAAFFDLFVEENSPDIEELNQYQGPSRPVKFADLLKGREMDTEAFAEKFRELTFVKEMIQKQR